MDKFIIAIDGPAGSGKSSVAKIISKKLNIEYVDSGAIYRGITKIILDSNIKIEDYEKIDKLVRNIDISLNDGDVIINGVNITPYIRTREVTELVSPISNCVPIRLCVNTFLNSYAQTKSIIMDGRDIGTVVFPDATYKIYMDASVDVRAKRRFDEKTTDMSLEEIKSSIEKRDLNDKTKPFGALKIAEDAVYLDTTNLSIDEVVDNILKIIKYNGA